MIDILQNIGDIVGTIDSAAGTSNRLISLTASLKELLKKTEAGTDADIKSLLADIANEIADTKIMNAALKEQVSALERRLKEIEAFDEDLTHYALVATPGGAVVYERQNPQADGLPPHFICPNCAAERRKLILQMQHGYTKARCSRCSTNFSVTKRAGMG
jgi:hypothetical protein